MPAKLYFRHGVVSSAKTLQLLAVSHTYQQQGKQVLLLKPAIDTRFGKGIIQSRAGLSATADIVISPDSHTLLADIVKQSEAKNIQVRFLSSFLPFELFLPYPYPFPYQCVLVDESQFLAARHVDDLRAVATDLNIPVLCYGLRTDFRSH